MNDEIKEILDYFQKDVDKYEESKKYLMEKYGYDEETIDNISQHKRHINTKILLDYITNLRQENQKYKEVIDKVKFAIKTNCIKNDKKYEEICCDGDYLLQILEDKEVK